MKTPWTRRIGRRLNMDFDYVASGGTLLMVDHAINLATSLLSLFVLTRTLDKSAYGVYAYIVGVFMLMMPLTLPG
ncbi:hypothetical protein KDL45_13880, partial [bacterium]|nr:hypothetical protein [bacterium]